VAQGLATKSIARHLQISTYTVQDHLRAIFEKLGVHSKQELVARVFFQDHLPKIEAGLPVESNGGLSTP
jgi:DNA-binding NarL/FixJ family response regulator